MNEAPEPSLADLAKEAEESATSDGVAHAKDRPLVVDLPRDEYRNAFSAARTAGIALADLLIAGSVTTDTFNPDRCFTSIAFSFGTNDHIKIALLDKVTGNSALGELKKKIAAELQKLNYSPASPEAFIRSLHFLKDQQVLDLIIHTQLNNLSRSPAGVDRTGAGGETAQWKALMEEYIKGTLDGFAFGLYLGMTKALVQDTTGDYKNSAASTAVAGHLSFFPGQKASELLGKGESDAEGLPAEFKTQVFTMDNTVRDQLQRYVSLVAQPAISQFQEKEARESVETAALQEEYTRAVQEITEYLKTVESAQKNIEFLRELEAMYREVTGYNLSEAPRIVPSMFSFNSKIIDFKNLAFCGELTIPAEWVHNASPEEGTVTKGGIEAREAIASAVIELLNTIATKDRFGVTQFSKGKPIIDGNILSALEADAQVPENLRATISKLSNADNINTALIPIKQNLEANRPPEELVNLWRIFKERISLLPSEKVVRSIATQTIDIIARRIMEITCNGLQRQGKVVIN